MHDGSVLDQARRAVITRGSPPPTAIQSRLFRNSTMRGSIVSGRSCDSTAVAETMSQRSLKATDIAVSTAPIARGQRVGAAAAFHRSRPRSAAQRRAAKPSPPIKIKVAHAIEVVVVRDAGRAIAKAELGAEIELHLGAAVGRLAPERLAPAPLVQGERPLHFGPGGARRAR